MQSQLIECEEYSISNPGDTNIENTITHQRFWKDSNYSSRYCMDYSYEHLKFQKSASYRENIEVTSHDTYYDYWGSIYKSLYNHDMTELNEIVDSLYQVKKNKDLNRIEAAHMIVKFVQDIPYSFVMSEPCEPVKDGKPCQGDSRFGILSPVEFLYTLKGDCDTRTVLLFSLLKNFGYEPLILISNEYLHSMIALNIPATGDYITHKGRKFYFWETTNTGWEPGMISPDMQNIEYWDVALDYDI